MSHRQSNSQAQEKVLQPEKNEKHPVRYEDLIRAKVQVMDKEGNLYYLEPSYKQGEFILRVIPK